MIKNILNWTAGGFFRALGRILCFLVIGLVIAYFISLNDFKLPDILGLGILKVHAATTTSWSSAQTRIRLDDHGTNTYTSWENNPHTFSPDLPVNKYQFRVKASAGLSYENTYIFTVGYKPVPHAVTPTRVQVYADTGTVEYEDINCGQWAYNDNDYNLIQCNFTPRNNISSSTWLIIEVNLTEAYLTSIRPYISKYEERTGTNAVITQTGDQITNEIDNATTEITNIITENNQNLINSITEQNQVCDIIDKNKINQQNKAINSSGNIVESNGWGITDYIKIDENTKLTVKDTITTGSYICFYNINKTTISCTLQNSYTLNQVISIPSNSSYFIATINLNQNKPQYKICKNGNQATNDLLSDTDTSNTTNEINDWFHNFNLGIEGPLSSIVLLPINLLETLIIDYNEDNVHSPICATLKGQEFCIPSGDLIWNRTGCSSTSWFGCPDYAQFKTFFQLIAGGLIIYSILKRIVKTIDTSLDPTDSDVKVVDL